MSPKNVFRYFLILIPLFWIGIILLHQTGKYGNFDSYWKTEFGLEYVVIIAGVIHAIFQFTSSKLLPSIIWSMFLLSNVPYWIYIYSKTNEQIYLNHTVIILISITSIIIERRLVKIK